MKFKEILKNQGLTDEQISSIEKEMKEEKIYTTSLENADERYTKLKGQKEDLDEQLKTANTTIGQLKKNNKDNEALQQTIKDHEATIETLKKESAQKDFNYALDSVLKDNKCKNTKALKALLNLDNIKFNEGKFEGLESQIEALKKSDAYLFDTEPTPTGGGFNPPGGGEFKNPYSKENWNLTEQMNLEMSNPTLAAQLREIK